MTARPSLIVGALAATGAIALRFATPSLPPSKYGPAALGAGSVVIVTLLLLRELPRGPRFSIATASGVLGFLVGAAGGALGVYPWAAGFGAAWLPAFLLFLAGFGSERLALELSRLENDIDTRAERPRVIARATEIRDAAEKEARALDSEGKTSPTGVGDARAVYAYAAQVVAYGHALDGRYEDSVKSLGRVPVPWMPAPMRLLMISNLAFWQLCTGDVEGAGKTVALGVEKDSLPESRPNLRATKALVLVQAGKPAEALAIVGREEGEAGEPERIRPRYTIVRAHALCAEGATDAARAEITRVLDGPLGTDEIRRLLPAGGPAKALIEDVMRDGPKSARSPDKAEAPAAPA